MDDNTCPKCGNPSGGGEECISCGIIISKFKNALRNEKLGDKKPAGHQCTRCGKQAGLLNFAGYRKIKDALYCSDCAYKKVQREISKIQVTTTPSLDGYSVKKYIDIESVEIVIGTGMFSEFVGGLADVFGGRSTAFEMKLQEAKRTALDRLKFLAFEKDGNAIIGIDIDYTEFSGNRIGLIANGTIVEVAKAV